MANNRSLYKYVTIPRLKHFLIDRTIRFTQAGAFNDPFELVPLLSVPSNFPEQRIEFKFSVTAPRRDLPNKLNQSAPPDSTNDQTTRLLRYALDRKVGFLSLSTKWDSLLMWSYYADGHAGAVIEFDGNHDFFTGAFHVHYTEHRPIRDLQLYATSVIPIAEMCDKPIEWKHESEVRLGRSLSDCKLRRAENPHSVYVMDVPEDCIKSVILGERAGHESLAVYKLIKNTSIQGYFAMLNHWDYKMSRHLQKWPSSPAFRVLPPI